MSIRTQYMRIQTGIHANTFSRGENPCRSPTKYMSLHANTYRDTYQIHTNTGSVNDTGLSPHVNVLACIVVCIGMYCEMVPGRTSKCINTYHNVQYIHMIVSVHTNTSRHILILAIHTIHTNAYQYRQTSINTDTSRVQTNTYQNV